MATKPTLQKTKKYGMFTNTEDNRTVRLNTASRKRLRKSMQQHGYLPAYPIKCCRVNGTLVVQDGQHRLAVAQELGLPVYYVVDDTQIDIPTIQGTQEKWKPRDYAESYAKRGNRHYQDLLEFADVYEIPLGVARQILGGNNCCKISGSGSSSNSILKFNMGRFEITSRDNAERVVDLYYGLGKLNPKCKTRFLIGALFAFTQIEGVDDKRLLAHARRKPELICKYGSRDGYLDMLETIYNFGSRVHTPIRIPAENCIRANSRAVAAAG